LGLSPEGEVMIAGFLDILFGCWHPRYSFPITAKDRRSRAAHTTGTYVVCLDCGKEFAYDWSRMKVVDGDEQPAMAEAAPQLANKQAA
jgi:hypothetical protein